MPHEIPAYREFTEVSRALEAALQLSEHSSIAYYVHSYPSPDAEQNVTFYAATAQPYHEGCTLIAQVKAGGLKPPVGPSDLGTGASNPDAIIVPRVAV